MLVRFMLLVALVATLAVVVSPRPIARACCSVSSKEQVVLNADQNLIILWDAENKTEHFIRQASFKGADKDFGFLVPSPTKPELNESGNEAFALLERITKPIPKPEARLEMSKGVPAPAAAEPVRVLEQKKVAGFNATVLEADDAKALVAWMKDNGFAYSPEVEAWAKPYIDQKWKFTALKIAPKEEGAKEAGVATPALRMSFKTERPLFPYRESATNGAEKTINPQGRLLRIYFIAETQYFGKFENNEQWKASVPYSQDIGDAQRKELLELLKLPANTGPAKFHVTKYDHLWPYNSAPSDLWFEKAAQK